MRSRSGCGVCVQNSRWFDCVLAKKEKKNAVRYCLYSIICKFAVAIASTLNMPRLTSSDFLAHWCRPWGWALIQRAVERSGANCESFPSMRSECEQEGGQLKQGGVTGVCVNWTLCTRQSQLRSRSLSQPDQTRRDRARQTQLYQSDASARASAALLQVLRNQWYIEHHQLDFTFRDAPPGQRYQFRSAKYHGEPKVQVVLTHILHGRGH